MFYCHVSLPVIFVGPGWSKHCEKLHQPTTKLVDIFTKQVAQLKAIEPARFFSHRRMHVIDTKTRFVYDESSTSS